MTLEQELSLEIHTQLLRDRNRGSIFGFDDGNKPFSIQIGKGPVANHHGCLSSYPSSPIFRMQTITDFQLYAAVDILSI